LAFDAFLYFLLEILLQFFVSACFPNVVMELAYLAFVSFCSKSLVESTKHQMTFLSIKLEIHDPLLKFCKLWYGLGIQTLQIIIQRKSFKVFPNFSSINFIKLRPQTLLAFGDLFT